MNRTTMKSFLCLILLMLSIAVGAQQRKLIVTTFNGKPEYVVGGHKHPLHKGLKLTEESLLFIPYNGSVTVIDDVSYKEYTFKTMGWASVEDKIRDSQHSIVSRTKEYLKSVLSQLSGNQPVRTHYVSDAATVTREYYTDLKLVDVEQPKQNKEKSFSDDYNSFVNDAKKEYNDFRKKAFKEYTDFVRQAWKEYGVEPPIEQPEEQEVEPILVPDADIETASWFSKLFRRKNKADERSLDNKNKGNRERNEKGTSLKYKEVITRNPPKPQPQPLSEVQQDPENANTYKSFKIFGTEIRVRIGENCRFLLSGTSENEVADALQEFAKPQFDNLLYDCLEMRKKYQMSDWAYYQMLMALTNIFYGKDTNEANLVLGFLFSQSGYKVRLARSEKELQVLIASEHLIYNTPYIRLDEDKYYIFNDKKLVYVCSAKYPKEGAMSLRINAAQNLAQNPTPKRTITSRKNPDFSFTITSNKNFMDFFDTYPPSCINDNFMTRWAMYANTPLEKDIKEQLIEPMKEKLKGLSQKDAVQQMLWWVQTGFQYNYDENVWGQDRAFFGEETLFYPYCDCEDRSILLSHLVRDILGLKVILIYYPGHLAMAVNFTDEVNGDYIMYDNKKFVVCDPTYILSNVGETMPSMKDKETVVILLD